MNPIQPKGSREALSQNHMSGIFLDTPGLLKEALKREKDWIENVPDYDSTMNRSKNPMTPKERSLFKLVSQVLINSLTFSEIL